MTLAISAALCFGMCVDTVTIAKALLGDARRRGKIADVGAGVARRPRADNPEGATNSSYVASLRQLEELDLPIGWTVVARHAHQPHVAAFLFWIRRLLGILFTTIAVSMGAPFWFDLLGKVVNLRGAGPPPPRSSA